MPGGYPVFFFLGRTESALRQGFRRMRKRLDGPLPGPALRAEETVSYFAPPDALGVSSNL